MTVELNKAARQMNAMAYRDGMVDLLIGAFFAMLAFQEPLEKQGFAEWISYLPSFAAMGVGLIVFALVKRKVVMPRIGRAQVSLKHNPARRKLFLFAVVLQLITLLVYILAATGTLGLVFPAGSGWIIDAFFAAAIFGFFAFLGYSADAPRFYLYGLLLGANVLIMVPLRGDFSLAAQLPILISGLVMIAGGLITLFSFLKQYPVVELETSDE